MSGEIATGCPSITADNFEQHLTSDDTLVDFLNYFLSLPSFPETLLYNQATGLFEVANGEAEHVSRDITSVHHIYKSQISNAEALLSGSLPIDKQYSVCCLDRKQGLIWVLQERFPLFIQSDCYFEYRLAKLLFQTINDNLLEEQVITEDGENNSEGQTFEFEEGSRATHKKNDSNICYHGAHCHSSRHGLDQFKASLQGTEGESTLNLWMDIERLKVTHTERKNRHLDLMRDTYLNSGGKNCINVDILNYLGISMPSYWTEEKLHLVQLHLIEVLLSYWAPRCWMLQHVQGDRDDSGNVGLWTEEHMKPASETHCSTLFSTLLLQDYVEFNTSYVSAGLNTEAVEKMLQALFFDSQAGQYFTCFCENSGNKLWQNTVYFWTDLQYYYQLLNTTGDNTYRIQRCAKLLYHTYMCNSATRSIGVDEVSNNTPTFKELLNKAGEHTLSVLLEAWTQLVARETETLSKIKQLPGGSDEMLYRRVVEDIQNSKCIEENGLPLFLATEEFLERQENKSQDSDSEQGCCRQPKKRRETLKLSDGLWMSYTQEILQFRRVLNNPVTCEQFQHFVSMKGDLLENDLRFWLEVQRCKELCHSHCDEVIIQHKISTIINCFLTCPVPPALQIDIPEEMAQHILKNRQELGPYIFREAQMTVFRELLKQWPQFQELRSKVKEEQFLPLLIEKGLKYKARQQRLKRNGDGERIQDMTGRPSVTDEVREKAEVDFIKEGERREKEDLRSAPKYKISWSYSKYMGALMKEEHRQRQLAHASSGTSSSCSRNTASGAGLRPSP